MAELHVQVKKKTTPLWVWIVVGLLVVAAIVFFLMRNKKANENNTVNNPAPTSLVQPASFYDVSFYA